MAPPALDSDQPDRQTTIGCRQSTKALVRSYKTRGISYDQLLREMVAQYTPPAPGPASLDDHPRDGEVRSE